MTIHSTTQAIPTPAGVTFDDVVRGLRERPIEFVTSLAQTYGDIVHLPFGERDLYLVNDPDFIGQIFVGGDEVYKKRRDEPSEQAYLGQIGGFLPLFNEAYIPGYAPLMQAAAQRTHARWTALAQAHRTPEIDIYREMMRATLEVVTETLFRADSSALSSALVEDILTTDHGYGFDPVEATLGEFMPRPRAQNAPEQDAARGRIQAYVQGLVEARGPVEGTPDSFLAGLIKYIGPEHAALVGMTVMFAMHEVCATTLTWAWALLSENPNVEAELHAELADVLGGRSPEYADLDRLNYTDMLLTEVRRLYPSVWLIGRFTRQDTQFNSHTVPANSAVLASQSLTHHDGRYFTAPDQCDPTRWTIEAQASRPEFAYFPFSYGPRACAGEVFAKVQDALILGALAQAWQARLVAGQTIVVRPDKSNAPRPGLRMTLQQRKA